MRLHPVPFPSVGPDSANRAANHWVPARERPGDPWEPGTAAPTGFSKEKKKETLPTKSRALPWLVERPRIMQCFAGSAGRWNQQQPAAFCRSPSPFGHLPRESNDGRNGTPQAISDRLGPLTPSRMFVREVRGRSPYDDDDHVINGAGMNRSVVDTTPTVPFLPAWSTWQGGEQRGTMTGTRRLSSLQIGRRCSATMLSEEGRRDVLFQASGRPRPGAGTRGASCAITVSSLDRDPRAGELIRTGGSSEVGDRRCDGPLDGSRTITRSRHLGVGAGAPSGWVSSTNRRATSNIDGGSVKLAA